MFRKVLSIAVLVGIISAGTVLAQGAGNSLSIPTSEFNNSVVVGGGYTAFPMKSNPIQVVSETHQNISGGGGA